MKRVIFSNIQFNDSQDKDRYYVEDDGQVVGEVIMQIDKPYIALSHIDIYKEFRGSGYGKKIVKLILDMSGIKGIVGESLKTSTKFWNNCIQTFGGYTTKEGRLFGNTAFAFVVGTDEKIDPETFHKLLTMCAKY